MKLYTQREVALLLRVTVRTLERLRERYRKEGRQFGIKVGGSIRFTQEHVDMVLRPAVPQAETGRSISATATSRSPVGVRKPKMASVRAKWVNMPER